MWHLARNREKLGNSSGGDRVLLAEDLAIRCRMQMKRMHGTEEHKQRDKLARLCCASRFWC